MRFERVGGAQVAYLYPERSAGTAVSGYDVGSGTGGNIGS